MRLVTFAGPPSCGKTSIIIRMIESNPEMKRKCGVIKFDCLRSFDKELYSRYGIVADCGLAGNLCPDHYFVSNIDQCFTWAKQNNIDILITESAGLCNRCSPHLKKVPAICVLDNLSGINTPLKTGPMLKFADVIIVTKSEIVSQAEKEVFRFKVQQVNQNGLILFVNGITGQGVDKLIKIVLESPEITDPKSLSLRFPMPSALCSYCLGETRIGEDFQIGLNRKITLS